VAQRAYEEAIEYAKNRKAFGRTISEFQNTQFKLADMATELDAARLLVYRAAWMRDEVSDRVTREASMAKLYATEMAWRVVDQALQIHGGYGVIRGSITERLYREIRQPRVYEGTSEIQRMVIARHILGG
jgi:acyl-CoA dehydrogenase